MIEMLLQTNSYIVPKDRRAEHARLMRRFRQVLAKLGCDNFEVYEQVGANWGGGDTNGRFVQIMRFRDRKHQLSIQNAERSDPSAQALINEFCELVNFPYQQQQGFFAVGFYNSVLPVAPVRARLNEAESEPQAPVPVGEAEILAAEEAIPAAEPDEIVQDQAEIELPPAEHEAPPAGEHESESAEAPESAAVETPHYAMDFGHSQPAVAETELAEDHPLEPDQIIAAEPPLELEGPSATSGQNVAEIPMEQLTEEASAAQPLSEDELLAEVTDRAGTTEVAQSTEATETTDTPNLEPEAQSQPDGNGEKNGESVEAPPPEQVRRRSSLFRRAPRNRG
jgi:hypothetical protein